MGLHTEFPAELISKLPAFGPVHSTDQGIEEVGGWRVNPGLSFLCFQQGAAFFQNQDRSCYISFSHYHFHSVLMWG